jgi:hypothetical protein
MVTHHLVKLVRLGQQEEKRSSGGHNKTISISIQRVLWLPSHPVIAPEILLFLTATTIFAAELKIT